MLKARKTAFEKTTTRLKTFTSFAIEYYVKRISTKKSFKIKDSPQTL